MSLKPIEKLKEVIMGSDQEVLKSVQAPMPIVMMDKINELIEVVNEQSEILNKALPNYTCTVNSFLKGIQEGLEEVKNNKDKYGL